MVYNLPKSGFGAWSCLIKVLLKKLSILLQNGVLVYNLSKSGFGARINCKVTSMISVILFSQSDVNRTGRVGGLEAILHTRYLLDPKP